MATSERYVSVTDHVVEDPELWMRRLSKSKWGDRIPQLVPDVDGAQAWVVDGKRATLRAAVDVGATLMGAVHAQRWADVPGAARDPRARLAAMDADGVDYSVLYPMLSGYAAETLGRIADPALELACVQAYNDWLVEEWASVSPRFIAQCIVPVATVDNAVAEVRRAVAKGHKGVVLAPIPQLLRGDLPHINDPAWDPLWSTIQELGVPLCMPASESTELQLEPYEGYSEALSDTFRAITRPATQATIVGNMLMSRVLRNFADLKVVFAESGLGWIVFALELSDHQFERMEMHKRGYELVPTDLFKRQCFITGSYERDALRHASDYVGASNILWGSKYPLTTSPWPNSRQVIARSFEGMAEADRRRVLWGNAASLYRLDS